MSSGGARALIDSFKDIVSVSAAWDVSLTDPKALTGEVIDRLVEKAVFGSDDEQETARWLIHELARLRGLVPASIQPLYDAMGRGEASGFTTPALNLRGLAYDSARAVVRTMKKLSAGPVVFELARSEMGYTFQKPAEYATVVIAAALREGLTGPLFIQGDHFQVSPKKYQAGGASREGELTALRALVVDAVAAGFYNIDIDSSTLVILDRPSLVEQQRENFTEAAGLGALVRKRQPAGVVISIGAEIGEVGGKNSTPEEFRTFMSGFSAEFARLGGVRGPSKISVQTGTSHGGVPLADGTVAKVALDFGVLRSITDIARREYGMAGSVQHGASTLPAEAFGKFPEAGAAEVHLATEFQNILFDHPALPKELRAEMYAWCGVHCADERKAGMTDEQFNYKARKRTWGPFKAQLWGLPSSIREAMRATLEAKFEFLFKQLRVDGGAATVAKWVKPIEVRMPPPGSGRAGAKSAAPIETGPSGAISED
ncbi:MAG: class II fructose-bisphosphate aldolase [Acidobacteria bacterium]|nr:class II fructose-bisphosphate aldolase [Acidobacteriota bacterium]